MIASELGNLPELKKYMKKVMPFVAMIKVSGGPCAAVITWLLVRSGRREKGELGHRLPERIC